MDVDLEHKLAKLIGSRGKPAHARDFVRRSRLNPRARRACAYYIAGNMTKKEAMVAAGYSPNTHTSSVFQRPDAKEYLEYMAAHELEDFEFTPARIKAELGKIAGANILDYFVENEEGDLVPDLAAVTRDHGVAITRMETEEYTEGRGDDAKQVKRVKFSLADKLQALEKLARIYGMMSDKVKIEGEVSIVERIQEATLAARKRRGEAEDGDSKD